LAGMTILLSGGAGRSGRRVSRCCTHIVPNCSALSAFLHTPAHPPSSAATENRVGDEALHLRAPGDQSNVLL
jgi:hypothetical protein